MDSMVDKKYKAKHFPAPAPSKPSVSSGAPAPTFNPATALQSPELQPQTLKELIASFSNLSIIPAPPLIEGDIQPPCPISELPDEILVHILQDLALSDVGDFVRLAQVCKRLAFLVATEDQIWRRVCLGPEFGFGGMHYQWQKEVDWGSLEEDESHSLAAELIDERIRLETAEKSSTTNSLLPAVYSSSWQRMFRTRPRIRFNGCYISTVNYLRSGQASPFQTTWNSPVHIITYFRYLRFFRDGTAISLLTTTEPTDVVHHLTKENMELHQDRAMAHLPSIVVAGALKGRWRLSGPSENPETPLESAEGDLVVETEGVGKYVYRLELSLRSAGKGARNNKLLWRGFYSYNKLTDDWGEFGLKNDKAFFFSRVKSYGIGLSA
jgi:F-box protein 9